MSVYVLLCPLHSIIFKSVLSHNVPGPVHGRINKLINKLINKS